MSSCSLPSAATWPARRGPARGTARSGPGCGNRRHPRQPDARAADHGREQPALAASTPAPSGQRPRRLIVAEHWNAEGLGWHVAQHGNRYAAAEALALAVSQVFDPPARMPGGGLLRYDHGSPFMSEHFQNQLSFSA
jgi:hypothetical protein